MFKPWMVLPVVFWAGVVVPAGVRYFCSDKPAPVSVVAVAAAAPEPESEPAAEPADRVQVREQALAAGALCDLELVSGEVVVTRAAGRVARLQVTIDGDSVRSGVRVEIAGDSKGLRAQAVYPSRRHDSGDVHYALQLPAGVHLRVKTVSGDVDVSGADGRAAVSTVSGEVHLRGVQGEPQVNTVSGDVDLEDVAGKLEVTTVSGDLRGAVSAGLRSARVTTVSGEVDLGAPKALPLSLHTSTVSGEVHSDFSGSGAIPVQVHTMSGDVQLHGT